MKTLVTLLLTALLPGLVVAQEKTTAEYTWQALADAGQLKAGTLVQLPDGQTALKVENPGPQPLSATVLIIDQPKITTDLYLVTGEVRGEGIEGDGYLEMWNHFGDTSAFFSRTLAESGPMGKLRGTIEWRSFILPFNATGAKGRPTRLVINVYLPGKGTVWLRSPIKLSESASLPGTGAALPGAWWSDRQGGLVGGIAGALLGCFGGCLGWMSSRGQARAFVIPSVRLLLGLGAASSVVGIIALAQHQPYGVWYPLLLIGLLLVLICPAILKRCERAYRELELRRMSSLDAA